MQNFFAGNTKTVVLRMDDEKIFDLLTIIVTLTFVFCIFLPWLFSAAAWLLTSSIQSSWRFIADEVTGMIHDRRNPATVTRLGSYYNNDDRRHSYTKELLELVKAANEANGGNKLNDAKFLETMRAWMKSVDAKSPKES